MIIYSTYPSHAMEIPFLTAGESKVYVALVQTGESTVGQILKRSGVSHSKIYDILKRLSEKGLVSTIGKGGRQHFTAADPLRLADLVHAEQERTERAATSMKTIIPQLQVMQHTASHTSALNAYEGMKGLKTVAERMLDVKKGDTILILGTPKKLVENVGGYMRDWQRRRIKKGAVCKLLTNSDAPSWDDAWWKESKRRGLTFAKRTTYAPPAYLIITKDRVATIYFSDVILAFLIEHEGIAQSYQQFFQQLWG